MAAGDVMRRYTFKAFFRRAKAGAGAASGYPRYKRTREGMSICFAEKMGSG